MRIKKIDMKKLALLSVLFLSAGYASAQKYSSKTGKVTFEASVPLFDDIFAQDDNNVVILNADNGEMASVSNVKNFHFKTKLMEWIWVVIWKSTIWFFK